MHSPELILALMNLLYNIRTLNDPDSGNINTLTTFYKVPCCKHAHCKNELVEIDISLSPEFHMYTVV